MEFPQLIDSVDPVTGKFDMFKFSLGLVEYDKKRKENVVENATKKKRPYMRRRVYQKRCPMSSYWWIDYVIDINHTWRDEKHRDGKLFRHHFSHSFDSVKEIVNKIQEPDHYFWKNRSDGRGRSASPIHLLVLGSLREFSSTIGFKTVKFRIFP
jgi:hypothetical protein